MRFSAMLALGAVLVTGSLAAAADNTEQLIKYYRKKANVPPTQKVTVTGLKDSTGIKGAKEGTLEVGEGAAAQKVPFTMSPDGKYAVFAAAEDVTADPSKAVMDKISLKGEPFKGGANAKVTIVEYSDFQCPFCSKGYNTIEKQVLPEYKDKVKFYYKHFPLNFHPWAELGAVAVECAKMQKPEAYWKLYSALFENQAQINAQNVKEKSTEFLKDTGVDMTKWNDCFDNKKSLDKVKAQMAEGGTVGVRGTPGFIINGRVVSGAQPFENFKNIIDDELASSK
jgi:protein-disulfide isomerase